MSCSSTRPSDQPAIRASRTRNSEIRPRSIDERLDLAAVYAVAQWEYEPTLLDGVAGPIVVTVTVNFALN